MSFSQYFDLPLLHQLLIGAGSLGALVFSYYILRAFLWHIFGITEALEASHSEKKSSEVRLGRIAETLAPLLDDFPVEVGKPGTSTVFMGQPVDYIHFDPEEGITIIEVKSGDAKVSVNQKRLREHIQAGNVFWAEYRINRK